MIFLLTFIRFSYTIDNMNDLIKKFDNIDVRIKDMNGNPWFVVLDVCKILGMSNPTESIRNIDKDNLSSTEVIDSMGRKKQVNIVNEYGLYDLIFKSRKPDAKKFQKWVTHEVLPRIRKTGSYSIPDTLKKKSTETRNMLTDEWKNEFNREELLLLNALESMEMLNLHYNPAKGFIECRNSLKGTAKKVIEVKKKKEIE